MTVATVAAVASATVVASTSAFVFPSRMPSSMTATARIRRPRPGVVVASSMMAVGGGRMPSSSSDGEDRLISSSRRLLLDEAFMNLDDADRYETVLVGLCAKIIDDGTENYAKSGLVDPLRLLGEMNDRGISMGPRGVVGLIDVSFFCSSSFANRPFFLPRRGERGDSRFGVPSFVFFFFSRCALTSR
jgi:hypothetical protein